MGANVFANGREVSAKKSDNQSIAAMPDVCLSPPSPPAGPIPIPYPNFSSASDTSDGTKTVKIAGDEAGMKDQSNYKTSKGDEAATRSLGMGVMTATIQGKTYFTAWSSDVMFEGANAVRFMDMTTHNHASQPANTEAMTTSVAGADSSPPSKTPCEELSDKNTEQRGQFKKDSRKTVQKLGSERTTITHGTFQSPGGSPQSIKACSRVLATKYDNGFVKGISPQDADAGKTNMCPEAKFKYAKSGRPLSSHTESRILETLMAPPKPAPPGTSVLMSINWKQGVNDAGEDIISDEPCPHCEKVICAAQACGIVIKLCQGGPPPTPQDPPACRG